MAWTEEEEKILKENYGKITAKEISDKYFPERKSSTIIGKANRMGLKSDLSNKTKPMPEDLDMSKEEWRELDSATRYYYRNREEVQEKKYKLNKKRRKKRKKWVRNLKAKKGCQECDETHPACLIFHHIDEKEDEISNLVASLVGINKLIDEIEKCAVLCSNCHRKHHDGDKIKNLESVEVNSTPE